MASPVYTTIQTEEEQTLDQVSDEDQDNRPDQNGIREKVKLRKLACDKEVYIYDDEEEMECLKIANPLVVVLAWSVMFTTVFCILYYGILNRKYLGKPGQSHSAILATYLDLYPRMSY